MTDNATRIAGGLLLLLGLWVAVYWTWPAAEPKTSFAGTSIETGSGVNGGKPAPIAVPPLVRPGETGDAPRGQEPTQTPPEPKGPEPVRPPAGADGGSSGPQLVPPQFVTHTVAEGETLGKISKKYFGTDAYASAIARANPFMDPTRMKPGRTIRVPKDPGNIQGKVEEPAKGPKGSGSEYVVQAGDSLSKIAKTVYNDERLANKIFEANKDRLPSPDKLKLGQKLRIPPKND